MTGKDAPLGSIPRLAKILFICLTFLVIASPQVRADATYSYTGPTFTLCDNLGSPCEVTNVSGSFTVATPFGANLSVFAFVPTSYSFTDGLTTWDSTNSSINTNFGGTFKVSTDSTGAIIPFWNMNIQQANPVSGGPPLTINTTANTGFLDDFTEGYQCVPISCPNGGQGTFNGIAKVGSGMGTWTQTGGTGGTVPEPGSLPLVATGLAVAGLMLTWKKFS